MFGLGAIAIGLAGLIGCGGAPSELVGEVDPQTVRRLPAGEVVGFTTPDDAHAWFGIPFAAPPLGPLRWRAPRPPEPWAGRLEALKHGPSCIQFANPVGGRDGEAEGEITGSEDCLYLNVYAPKFAPDAVPEGEARLPVLVWIHGGGNSVGDAVLYDGSLLAHRERVIVVTVHYRLGVLGWFSHPALRTPGTSAQDGSGNYGTLDLAHSLAWVKQNIAGFGGDPNRVVVFGESAGGSNVFSMLLSPVAAGRFDGAIAQSGSAVTNSRSDAENLVDDPVPGDPASSNELLLRYLVAEGRAADRAGAKAVLARTAPGELSSFLRGLTPEALLAPFEGQGFGGMYPSVELIRDGVVLPSDPPLEAFRRGNYNQVPAILGTNRDETRLFQVFSSPFVASLFGMPLWLKDKDLFQASAEHPSRMWKVRGADAPASAMRAVQGPSVYGYRFDWDDEPDFLFLETSAALGAAHGLELPFVFGWLRLGAATRFIFDEALEEQNRALSNQMMSYWSNFAYTGRPGRGRAGDQPEWQAWSGADGAGDHFLVFDLPADGGVRMVDDAPLSVARVIEGVQRDARLAERLDLRCEIYRGFVERGAAMSAAEYETVEAGRCGREHPLPPTPIPS